MVSNSLYADVTATGFAGAPFVSRDLSKAESFFRSDAPLMLPFGQAFGPWVGPVVNGDNPGTHLTAPQLADAVTGTWVEIKVPGILGLVNTHDANNGNAPITVACSANGTTPLDAAGAALPAVQPPRWRNNLGHAAIKDFTLRVGGLDHSKLDGMVMHMLEEFCGQPGRQMDHDDFKFPRTPEGLQQRLKDTRRPHTIWAKVPIVSSISPDLLMPLASMSVGSAPEIVLASNSVEDLAENPSGLQIVKVLEGQEGGLDATDDETACPFTAPLSNQDLKMRVMSAAVLLCEAERLDMATGDFSQIAKQWQINREPIQGTPNADVENRLDLNVRYMVQDMMVGVRLPGQHKCDMHFHAVNANQGGMYDPSNPAHVADHHAVEPIKQLSLFWSNGERQKAIEGKFWRSTVSRHYHSRKPADSLYQIPFSLDSEAGYWTGGTNIGRFGRPQMGYTVAKEVFGAPGGPAAMATMYVVFQTMNKVSYNGGFTRQEFGL